MDKPFENKFNTKSSDANDAVDAGHLADRKTVLGQFEHCEKLKKLPDVSYETKPEFEFPINKVGMRKVEVPLKLSGSGKDLTLSGLVDVFVSLDNRTTRGIHMSRLYLEVLNGLRSKTITSFQSIQEILDKTILTHSTVSQSGYLNFQFQLPVDRESLLSGQMGHRLYPVQLVAKKVVSGAVGTGSANTAEWRYELNFEIMYSSTCPCSASLSDVLLEEDFLQAASQFQSLNSTEAIEEIAKWIRTKASTVATAHAQRSVARIRIELTEDQYQKTQVKWDLKSDSFYSYLVSWIDEIEDRLGTPVQAAVKRIDEQRFAKMNGNNLMFCEDAARKLRSMFEDLRVHDFRIEVEHQESLHPHDAVSVIVKGIPGGFHA